MYVTGSNPLSTQDDVAAALAAGGLHVFALHGCTGAEYDDCLRRVVEADPDIIIDDGGDIMHMIRSEFSEKSAHILGGCEETTTGILRALRLRNGSLMR